MTMSVHVLNSKSDTYRIECASVEYICSHNTSETDSIITQFNQSVDNIDIYIDNGNGNIVFSFERNNIHSFDEEVFADDFSRIANACDSYTKDIYEAQFRSKVYDWGLYFIQNLVDITFSSSCNNSEIDYDSIVRNVVLYMGLEQKMEEFRCLSDDITIMPCFPQDKESKQQYIIGLLMAMLEIEEISYIRHSKAIRNDVIFKAMRDMKMILSEREKIIDDYIKSRQLESDLEYRLLNDYLFMADDSNRATIIFEHLGIES